MISIIIPIYNTEKYLEECLDSVKNQTFSDFECLCVDDGCIDNCSKIIKKYCKEDSRFKYLGGIHIGFPPSRKLGLDNAKGDFICFLDSDDFLEPQYLEKLYNLQQKYKADICCCCINSFKNNDYKIKKVEYKINVYKEDRMCKIFSHPVSSFMWNKIFKKELFEGIEFKNVIALSDTLICYKLIEKANLVVSTSELLINHRIHNENITYRVRNFEPTYWEYRLNVYIDICSYLIEKYPQYSKYYKNLFKGEIYFIKPHLSEEVYNNYREKIKKLL